MGDFVQLLNGLNLTPLNTILLVALGFFIRWAVKQILCRLTACETRLEGIERRDRKQNHAIWRIEQKIGLEPIPEDIEF